MSLWIRRLTIAACVLAMGALIAGIAVMKMSKPLADSAPTYDYGFTGDPAPLQQVSVPAGFREVTDVPACLATKVSRCFVTRMDRTDVLGYLHGAVGGAAHDNNDGQLRPGWTACGAEMGVPAVARISRYDTAAIRTGAGQWRFPRTGPVFDGRLTVGIFLFNAPHCVS